MDTSVRKTIDERLKELPETSEQLLKDRKLKQDLISLNDQVDTIFVRLWGDQDSELRSYLAAVYDEEAIEGSCAADNLKAAELIRDSARKSENYDLGRKKLATIVKSLRVVKRRYGKSRQERRNTVGGEYVRQERNGSDSE